MRFGSITWSVASLAVAGALGAGCGSTPAGTTPPPETTAPVTTPAPTPETTAPVSAPTTAPVGTSTTTAVAGTSADWILVLDVDDRDIDAVHWVVERVTLDGTVTTLLAGDGPLYPAPLDADVARNTMLARRVTSATGPGFQVLEYDLAAGTSRLIAETTARPEAEYVRDGSGDVLVLDEATALDEQGGASSTEAVLRLVAPDGTTLAELERRAVDPAPAPTWLQLPSADGHTLVVLSGAPMRTVDMSGRVVATFDPAGGRWCDPVRQDGTAMIATCHEPSTFFGQVWSFPTDGGAPSPITASAPTGPSDLGSWNVWPMPSGVTYVSRIADCGSSWVEQLQADGSTTTVDTFGGSILGRDGDRLVVALSACDGTGTRIDSVDPVTGDTFTLVDSRFPQHPSAIGISSNFGVAWVTAPATP